MISSFRENKESITTFRIFNKIPENPAVTGYKPPLYYVNSRVAEIST